MQRDKKIASIGIKTSSGITLMLIGAQIATGYDYARGWFLTLVGAGIFIWSVIEWKGL
jgi:hypothetical protein